MSRLFFASWKDVIKYSARVRANMVGAEGEENFVPDTSHCRKVLLSNILQQEYEGKLGARRYKEAAGKLELRPWSHLKDLERNLWLFCD